MLKILSLIVALIYISLGKSLQDANFPPFGTAAELRQQVSVLTSKGDYVSVIQLLEDVNKTFGTLHLDDVTPSFYSFMGVALYNVQRVIDAQKALEKATELFPNETRAWVNLGEVSALRVYLDLFLLYMKLLRFKCKLFNFPVRWIPFDNLSSMGMPLHFPDFYEQWYVAN